MTRMFGRRPLGCAGAGCCACAVCMGWSKAIDAANVVPHSRSLRRLSTSVFVLVSRRTLSFIMAEAPRRMVDRLFRPNLFCTIRDSPERALGNPLTPWADAARMSVPGHDLCWKSHKPHGFRRARVAPGEIQGFAL